MSLTTTNSGAREPDFQQLRVLEALLKEGSLTKAALTLDMSQPAVSKTLAKLRAYFDDPLFVRVGLRMEATPRALALAEPIAAILSGFRQLDTGNPGFDPRTSTRRFTLYMIDGAIAYLLPALMRYLEREAPRVLVQAVPCDARHLDLWLESGVVDVAIGSFPALVSNVRRQALWTDTYATLVRIGHPRVRSNPSLAVFAGERHALVAGEGWGHHYAATEQMLEEAIPPPNVICRVPTFTTAAHIVKHSDALTTMPCGVARSLAADLGLAVFDTPLALPELEVGQYWHEKYHRDSGNQWLRAVLREVLPPRPLS
jgi:DNA-binding transcriptional LysR family regulator